MTWNNISVKMSCFRIFFPEIKLFVLKFSEAIWIFKLKEKGNKNKAIVSSKYMFFVRYGNKRFNIFLN